MKTPFRSARSIRCAAFVTMICAIAALQACSSDTTPTAPPSVTPEPATQHLQFRISGTVTDNDGTPVPGVVVTIYRWMAVLDPGLAVITDDRGFYSMSFPSAAGISILVSKNGYASGWHTHLIGGEGDFQLDVRIYRMPKTAGN